MIADEAEKEPASFGRVSIDYQFDPSYYKIDVWVKTSFGNVDLSYLKDKTDSTNI